MTLKKLSSVAIGKSAEASTKTGMPNTNGSSKSIVPSSQMRQAALTKLVQLKPDETVNQLVSGMMSLGVLVEPRMLTRFPDNSVRITITHYDVHTARDITDERIDQAIERAMCSLTPMPEDDMYKNLQATVMLMAKPAGESANDLKMRLQLLVANMSDWPADIFLASLKAVAETNKFFPAFAEFHRHYSIHIRKRRLILEALHKYRNEHFIS